MLAGPLGLHTLLKKVFFRSQCCVHAELSFGGSSYLIQRPGGNVLVDVPRFNPKLLNRVKVPPRRLACAAMLACTCSLTEADDMGAKMGEQIAREMLWKKCDPTAKPGHQTNMMHGAGVGWGKVYVSDAQG